MSAVALNRSPLDGRRRHQARVSALLDEIEGRRRELYRLRAYGATPAGLAGLKEELKGIRRTLAATVSGRD